MPRFFFHIHDGTDIPDTTGTELPNWRKAQSEAVRKAGYAISDSSEGIGLGEDWVMEVTDDNNVLLFRLSFYVGASPAITDGHGPDR